MIPLMLERTDAIRARPINREEWLSYAAVLLRPWFSTRGYEIPLRIRIGVGALGVSRRILGVQYVDQDADGFRHISISPFIDDPVTVVLVMAHELIHAMLPAEELHGPLFRKAASSLGLRPPFTVIGANPDLQHEVDAVVRRLGRYPHRAPLARGAVYSVR